MTCHHHGQACTDFEIASTIAFEDFFGYLTVEFSRNLFRRGLSHGLGKSAGFRQRLSIWHHDLHYIADSIDSGKRSLHRARIHVDPTTFIDQSTFFYNGGVASLGDFTHQIQTMRPYCEEGLSGLSGRGLLSRQGSESPVSRGPFQWVRT